MLYVTYSGRHILWQLSSVSSMQLSAGTCHTGVISFPLAVARAPSIRTFACCSRVLLGVDSCHSVASHAGAQGVEGSKACC